MLAIAAILASFAVGTAFLISKSLFVYFRDGKGLRKFPGLTSLSPFTNLPYMWYAHRGWRYLAVHEAHRKLGPVVRVGPNSVSFNEIAAVKDILGHGSPATKDTFYELTAGTHRHLADVSSKPITPARGESLPLPSLRLAWRNGNTSLRTEPGL
jgi:hypothetical protein